MKGKVVPGAGRACSGDEERMQGRVGRERGEGMKGRVERGSREEVQAAEEDGGEWGENPEGGRWSRDRGGWRETEQN